MSAKLCKYTYFYIHDHLGSTSMVLDVDGNISQSVTYIPYGEVFVEERNGAWNSPYLFNAKELDEETGLYYYGARYLNPTNGMWLSVDPLFEKYVGMSPYNYCAGNPVKLVDPDGRDWVTAEYEGETFIYFDENIKSQDDIVKRYYAGETRSSYDIEYMGESFVFASADDGTFQLNSDGSYIHNGNTRTDEYSNDGSLHVGSSNHTTVPHDGIPDNNWYGNYLGPNNPTQGENSTYSYAIPPIDDLDYAAFLHDKGYDLHGAEGASGALGNENVVPVDQELVNRCRRVTDVGSERKNDWADRTAKAFSGITKFKSFKLFE